MYVQEKINTFFSVIVEGKKIANAYFDKKNIGEINTKRLKELQDKLKNSEKKYKKMYNIFSIAHFFKVDNLSQLLKKVEKNRIQMEHDSHELNIFESKLSFLIISGIINMEKAQELGFSNEYLISLLSSFKHEVGHITNKYYYNEKDGITSIIMDDRKRIILSYTPRIVLSELIKRNNEPMDKLKQIE